MTEMLQKTENVANENSQDLTSQWKKGEFIICNAGKCQYYYVQNEKQQEVIKTEYCLFDDNSPNWQVLAPVPSYEEYLSLTYAKEEDEKIIAEYEEENAQLKELLKECKDLIELMQAISGIKQIKFTVIDDFVKKINEVLDA